MVFFLIILAGILFFMFNQSLAATLVLCGAFWLSGWYFAHTIVATECERLGKFYVDKNVYQCVKIENVESSKERQ
ncbi:hypothetical protein [Basfia succiniciproducens]|uniref:hypothetical protein n=1 Tax=Basfia succiniciproducens TaxID=653940 RepID=UPI0008CDCA66|nr:hypothetical protein [Basfia succiniciproducens]SEQ76912.1 hypothetical protein SAMN02910415_02025 [Basfia succiniciproducens]